MTETSNYPTKCWYVAATVDEVGGTPLGRRILGRDVVLWRTHEGRVVALEDRCAHRGFPLSHGKPLGENLVCGYHGCTYDSSGMCVEIPTQQDVPVGMSVPAFPIFEEAPFIWIWLGPPRVSAGSRPPRMPWLTDSQWGTFGNTWRLRANYMMAHEHYLDFSYAPVLHHNALPPGIDRIPAVDSVEVTETTVSYSRHLPDAPLAAWEAKATGLDASRTYTRREGGSFVSPALHVQRWEIEAESRTYSNVRVHALTPETPDSTHVFMVGSWNYAPGDRKVREVLKGFLDDLIDRDRSILDMAAARVGYDGWISSVEFQADAAAREARRIVGVMVAKEAGRAALRPGVQKSKLLIQKAIPSNHPSLR
jgi:vanillate O-demethylase monooxygenase subunit